MKDAFPGQNTVAIALDNQHDKCTRFFFFDDSIRLYRQSLLSKFEKFSACKGESEGRGQNKRSIKHNAKDGDLQQELFSKMHHYSLKLFD